MRGHFTLVATLALLANFAAAQEKRIVPASFQSGTAVRGVVRGVSEVTLAADIVARVAEAPLRDGDRFRKGDVLLRFDCAAMEAERDAAEAAYRGHKNNYESNRKLKRLGAGSEFAIISAKSDMEKAEAEVRRLIARLRACTIRAPFDGRVIERVANPHETPGANQPLVRIVDDSDLDIQLVVPSKWLVWLRPETEFTFTADETGKTYAGRIQLIGAVVDPVSQTVRLRGAFINRPNDVLAGMSGVANLDAAAPALSQK